LNSYLAFMPADDTRRCQTGIRFVGRGAGAGLKPLKI